MLTKVQAGSKKDETGIGREIAEFRLFSAESDARAGTSHWMGKGSAFCSMLRTAERPHRANEVPKRVNGFEPSTFTLAT